MITGVVAQEPRVPAKGTIPFKLFLDFEDIPGPLVSSGLDQILRAGLALDAESVFAGTDMPQVLVPDFFPSALRDVGEFFFMPLIAPDQIMYFSFCVDDEMTYRPDIRIRGVLQTPLHVDGDTIFSTPLVLDRGMLRQEIPHYDLEAFPAPIVIAPWTLHAGLVLDIADRFFTPLARCALGAPFLLHDDYIPNFRSTWFHSASLVFDDARPLTTVATMDGQLLGVGISNNGLTATRNLYATENGSVFGASSSIVLNSGKFFFEVTVNQTGGSRDSAGVMQSTASFGNMLNHIYCTAVFFNSNGQIWSNNQYTNMFLGTVVAGDVISCAIDLDNKLGWFRKNGGRWNGLTDINFDPEIPSYPIDPASALGGVAISLGLFSPTVAFGQGGVPGDEIVFNFGASAYLTPKPDGFDHWRLPSPFPVSQSADRFGVAAIGTPATLDAPPDGVIVSGGNLTAAMASNLFVAASVESLSIQNFGKFYFEVTVTSTHGASDAIGITRPEFSSQQVAAGGVVLCGSPAYIYANSNTQGNFGGYIPSGTVIGVAVDLTDQTNTYGGAIWFRLNGGPWNNNASADPAVRAGGASLGGFNYGYNWTPVIGFGGSGTVFGDTMTANFGQTPFASPAPLGFTVWPAKILNVIQALAPSQVIDNDVFNVPFIDSSVKILSCLEVVAAPDAIFGAVSFGGNLAMTVGSVVQAPDVIYGAGNLATFDGVNSSQVTVSNGGRTATLNTSAVNVGARSAGQQFAGKYYFEVAVNTVHGNAEAVGILDALGSFFNLINNGTNCTAVFSNGTIYSNGSSTGKSIGAFVNGDTISCAINLSTRKAWLSRSGGYWNGVSTDDPASGAGGVLIAGSSFSPVVGFGGGSQVIGDAFTGNFGQAAFIYPIPAGFLTGWPAGSTTQTASAPLVTDNDTIQVPRVTPYNLLPAFFGDNDSIFLLTGTGGNPTVGPVLFSETETFYVPFIAALAASFDDTQSLYTTLSNGNLTATHANTSIGGTRSLSYRTTGKFYFEVTMTTTHGAFDCAGVISSAGTYTNFVSNGTNCLAVYKNNGAIFSNNTNSGKTIGAIAAGDVIGIAVDLAAGKGWVRKNGGFWNGVSTENPVTGVGGVTIAPTTAFAPAIGFGGSGTAANDAMTVNFGGTTYLTPAPSGFLAWGLSAPVLATLDPTTATATPLSNGNLTASGSSANFNIGARTVATAVSGKLYFEATIGPMTIMGGTMGILVPNTTYQSQVTYGQNTSTVLFVNGQIYSNEANSGKTLGAMVTGTVVACAVDMTAHLAWFRKNQGGTVSNWNGDPTANPATGVGGVTINITNYDTYGPSVAWGVPTANGDLITLNFGAGAYNMTVPAGFGNWIASK